EPLGGGGHRRPLDAKTALDVQQLRSGLGLRGRGAPPARADVLEDWRCGCGVGVPDVRLPHAAFTTRDLEDALVAVEQDRGPGADEKARRIPIRQFAPLRFDGRLELREDRRVGKPPDDACAALRGMRRYPCDGDAVELVLVSSGTQPREIDASSLVDARARGLDVAAVLTTNPF